MKQLFLFLFIILGLLLSLSATVRTVSNNPATLAQYNTIQAAVNASSGGDTIYVHGSPNDYAAFTITDTRLVIIGPGWSPDKNLPFTANVNGITVTGTLSNNTEIHGLTILGAINLQTGASPDGLKFIRNYMGNIPVYMQQGATYSDYLFEGNYFYQTNFYGTSAANYTQFLFHNNVFYSTQWAFSNFLNNTSVLLDHNLFYGPGSGSADIFVNDCRYLLLTNNIFVRRNAAAANSFSTFNNNITYLTSNDNPWAANGNTNAGGNVAGQNPLMVDQTAVNSGTNNFLLNFTIASGPANNAGSDGKDMGLLFDATGSLNWTNSRMSRLPFIYSMNITNPTIPAGGSLNVQVEARKSN